MLSRRSGGLAALFVAMMLLAACSGADDPEGTAGEAAVGTEAGAETSGETADADAGGSGGEDELVIGLRADLNSIDLMRRGSIGDIGVLLNIYGEHTHRTDDGTIEPGLLESWESNEDATVWTMKLREGLTFHNGDPVTAEDLAWSVERAATIDEDITAYWATVESAEPIDDLTVEVTLSEPNPLQMRSGELAIQPKAYFEEVGDQGFQEAPVGAGPYKVVEYRAGDALVLEAFEDYWAGEPPIKNVTFRIYPDDAARAAAFRAGDIHIAEYLPLEEYVQMQDDPNLGTAIVYGAPRNLIIIDTNKAPFDKVEARQALNHAINWDLIIEQILQGEAQRLAAVAIPEEIAHNPELEPYAYDPDLARELLAEAGYPDGVDVDFTVRLGYPQGEEVSAAIQAQLQEVGIRAEIQQVANADYGNMAAEKNIGNIAWSGYVGDGSYVGHAFHSGRMICGETASSTHGGFYCNDEIAQLLDEAYEAFASDEDAAQEALQEIERIVYEDAALGFGYQRPNIYGVHPDLNWEPTPFLYMIMDTASWS